MNSINKIDLLFKSIFDAHPSIQGRYRMGPDLDLSSNELDYPRIHIVPVSSSINQNLIVHRLNIMCVDIAKQDDNQMVKEVWSDTHAVLEDLVKFIRAYDGDPGWFDVLGNPQTQPILEDFRDRFTGHGMVLDLQVDMSGPCDVPIFNPDICGFVSRYIPDGPQGQSGRTGPQGPMGPQGFQGIEGIDGSNAVRWLVDLSAPNLGTFQPNQNDLSNVTHFKISVENIDLISYQNWLEEIRVIKSNPNGSVVYLKVSGVTEPTSQAIYIVDSIVDMITYYEIWVSLLNSSGGPFEPLDTTYNVYSISYSWNVYGATGSTGVQGFQGRQGSIGFQGLQGFQGLRGERGIQGFQGHQGFQGNEGIEGANAANSLYWENIKNPPILEGDMIFDSVDWINNTLVTLNDNSWVSPTTTTDSFNWLKTMSNWDAISTVYVQFTAVGQGDNYCIYTVDGMTEGSGEWEISLGPIIASSGTASIGDQVYVVSYQVIGQNGSQGFQGRQGLAGSTGFQGFQGFQGRQGFQGSIGLTGFQGHQGPGTIQVTSLTMSQASWTYSAPFWNYTITSASILSDTYVQVIPNNIDYSIVFAAFILPANLSSVGQVIVYALNQPTGDIGVTINIIKAL